MKVVGPNTGRPFNYGSLKVIEYASTKNLSCGTFSVPAFTTLEEDMNIDRDEVYFVVKGAINVLEIEEKKRYSVRQGECLVIPQRVKYQVSNEGGSETVVFYATSPPYP
jgi:mannose-6-phosphate isomerase-like protein (cupin superfamily)